MTKFKTAEEFLGLTEEQQLDVARDIVRQGWGVDAGEYIDSGLLASEMRRIEELAMAIGDVIHENRDLLEEELEEDVNDVLYGFMSEVADWTNQEYGGEYRDHGDGFWVNSNC